MNAKKYIKTFPGGREGVEPGKPHLCIRPREGENKPPKSKVSSLVGSFLKSLEPLFIIQEKHPLRLLYFILCIDCVSFKLKKKRPVSVYSFDTLFNKAYKPKWRERSTDCVRKRPTYSHSDYIHGIT